MRRFFLFSLVMALALGVGGSAWAAGINFDEFPAVNDNSGYLTEEYAYLGVHFATTDDGSTWSGLSAGDFGNWDLEGTNGTAFLGFNGESYGLTMTFDAPVNYFSMDVARSNGSSAGDSFTIEAWLGGSPVGSISFLFGEINEWAFMSFSGLSLDKLVWYGAGGSYHPYGVDNMAWESAGVPIPAAVWLLGSGLVGLAGLRRKLSK